MARPIQHEPVLLEEVLDGLNLRPNSRCIDGTVGAGGHARGILERSAPNGQLLGLDADPEAIHYVEEILRPFAARVTWRNASFAKMGSIAGALGFESVDGILLDLGISSRQLDNPERGFSFREKGPLDMRMDPNQRQTAADLVNDLEVEELARVIWLYGEERYSRRIARAIVAARPIETTEELATLVERTIGRREKIHPATRTFQALRIATNRELEALEQALPQARDLLKPGGRLAVISFHSLEDRLVKRFFQQEARDCICPVDAPICTCQHRASLRIITRKPVQATPEEIDRNPRSRSAKLRIAERTAQEVAQVVVDWSPVTSEP